MNLNFTLNDFLEWAMDNSLGFTIHFSEAEYSYEIRINSNSDSEDYYEKKVSMHDLKGFTDRWGKNELV